MEIPIGDKYRLKSNVYDISLQTKTNLDDPDKESSWRDLGFYTSIESALKGIVDKEILRSEAKSISELLNHIKETKKMIDEAIGIEDINWDDFQKANK